MTQLFLVMVLVATAAVVGAGLYLTFQGFRAVDRKPVAPKPRQRRNPHDAVMTGQLKHFFEGKQCVECNRPIPPLHVGDLRPGLLNTSTHQAIEWDDIPSENLSATLNSHQPLCSNCVVLEEVRRINPELVVDRHRAVEHPSI